MEKYLNEDLIKKLKLVQREGERELGPEDIHWTRIRDTVVRSVGLNQFPVINISEEKFRERGELYLKHEFSYPYDRRQLDEFWTQKTLEYVYLLWGNIVSLETVIPGHDWSYIHYFDG